MYIAMFLQDVQYLPVLDSFHLLGSRVEDVQILLPQRISPFAEIEAVAVETPHCARDGLTKTILAFSVVIELASPRCCDSSTQQRSAFAREFICQSVFDCIEGGGFLTTGEPIGAGRVEVNPHPKKPWLRRDRYRGT
jgi:hypothetical protein